jgi:DNA-binding helix-hairpin-helix protein with protein kinase domain
MAALPAGSGLAAHGLALRRRAERRVAPLRNHARASLAVMTEAEKEALALDAAARADLEPMLAAVGEARRAVAGAGERLARELAAADESYRQMRLEEHLRSRLIARAGIPGVGVSWRAMLASFGIETALEVSAESLRRVPALRTEAISELLAWRLESEQSLPRSRHSDRQSLAPAEWRLELKRRHGDWLAGAAAELRRAVGAYRDALGRWDGRIAAATAATDKARRECRLAMAILGKPPTPRPEGGDQ